MKYYAITILFVLLFNFGSNAQNVCGARMAALNGSAITHSDAFAGFHNLSAIAQLKGSSFAFFGQAAYGFTEIKDAGAAILQHLGTGVMGVVFQSYGNTEFSRQRMNLGYALPLSDKFRVSSSIGYSSTRISNGYGKAHTLWTNIGATYDVRADWKWAAVIDFPVSALKNAEEQPATLRMATTYSFGEQVFLSAQVISSTNAESAVSYSLGLEYFPIEVFAFRLGINTHWQTWSMGVGTHLKNYSLDASATVHPQLGITPQISLTYEMEK